VVGQGSHGPDGPGGSAAEGTAPHGQDRRALYDRDAPRLPGEAPIDLREEVPGDPEADLELDIGFGRGLSVYERADAVPVHRILGIEIRTKWAYLVAEGVRRRGLGDRVRVVCGDARDILGRAVPDASVARVFLHFPDPWWKKRHAKRRVVDDAFLDELARLLRDGGDLFFQSDVEERAAGARDLLADHPAFVLRGDRGFVPANPFEARSNRERRAAEDGLPVYRVLARRRPR